MAQSLLGVAAVALAMGGPAMAAGANQDALDVLQMRAGWGALSKDLLGALAEQLGSVEKTVQFVELCERTGILENNIVALAKDDSEATFVVGGIATTLTSYANAMGQEKKYEEARSALELVLLLRPRHVSAWMSMAIASMMLGDCASASIWADKVISFIPDSNSADAWEQGMALSMTEEGQRLIRENLGAGGTSWQETKEMMAEIKKACSQ